MFKSRLLFSIGLVALFLSLMGLGQAQVAGRLSGSVVDPTGAAIPGAAVNVYIRGGATPVLTTKTNDAGLFSFGAVRPDSYDVEVVAQGFAKNRLRDVKVDPIQEKGLGAIRLEISSGVQIVEVEAVVQSVQLNNSEVSSTITSTQVQNLPVLGRQISVLFATQPGVNPSSSTTSVNGLRSSFTNVTLDGVNIQDNFIRVNDLDYMPMKTTIDQVAEITISTSNADTTIGGGASQMVLSTKSGSNDYHGALYWFNRNSALAANDWFNNQSGVKKSFLDLNQVGVAGSGPIIKDKLFFYSNYEAYRNKRQSGVQRTVLTDSAKNGIFTYRDSANNLKSVNLQSIRNFQLDPTVKAMISQLPSPNNSNSGDGLNTSGYRFNARYNENRDQFIEKTDYYLSSKHSITATYNYMHDTVDRPDAGAFFTSVPPVTNDIRNHMLSVAWRWTASSTLTNEARVGFLRANAPFTDSNEYPKAILGGLLFSNPVNTFLNQGRSTNTYTIQDNANWVKGKHQVSFGFQSQLMRIAPFNDAGIVPTYNLGISAAYTQGLTATDLPGIRSTDLSNANSLYANLAGIISSETQTFNVTSTTSGFVPGATNLRNFTLDNYAGYIRDKWKIRPRLTLTFGLRYEYWKPLDEKNSLYLAPRLENNNIQQTLLDPAAVLDFIGGSAGRPFYKTDKNNLAPNFGFAYDVFGDGKTALRGGYAISYVNDNVVTAVRNNVGTANGLQFGNTLSNLVSTLANPTPIPAPTYKVPRTLQDNYAISTTSAVGMPDPNLVTPYVQQWNFGIQREFKGAVFEARYVGNHGTKLIRAFDYNQVLYNANGFLADFKRAQGNAALSEAAGLGYNGSYNPAIAGSQQLTVFPLLAGGGNLSSSTYQLYLRQGQIGELANQYQVNKQNGQVSFYTNPLVQGANTVANTGSSTYNAFQFDVQKRMRSGLQLQFNYSFSKALGNTSGDLQTGFEPFLDNNNPSLERSRSPFDITHSFKANYYYELPYGAGKRWSGGKIMNGVLGGWSLAGVWSYQSGSPYSILSGLGTLNRSARSSSTNTASIQGTTGEDLSAYTSGVWMTGKGPYFLAPSLLGADGRGASSPGSAPYAGQVFFNPTAGTLGNLQRRMFSGPWQWSWDMSVKKSFKIRERQSVEINMDAFNYMNLPTFYVPSSSGDYGSQTNFTINNTTFGKITSMNYNPRVIQFGLYYRF